MGLAIYNRTTNKVQTVIRDDHGGYLPPPGWELVPVQDLPAGWTRDISPQEAAAAATAAKLTEHKTRAKELTASLDQDVVIALRALAVLTVDQLNVLRKKAGLAEIGYQQALDAWRAKVDTLNGG